MKKEKMKCVKCGGWAGETTLVIDGFRMRAWKCKKCGEEYLHPEDAEKALILNKYKRGMKVKVGTLGESTIVRIPKELAHALGLEKGKEVEIKSKDAKHIEVVI
ncbi:MAG: AbrB/MazE/SpoVT family DNA-binding domain-containing protein [Euryarchaeota archaeon]|nr:AbrB/MazE/SpoVT family DNA-binding domain-containing protein [Euryarchaeota archaeon]